MAVLAVIPARGGSKGVLRKNVRVLAGKPLLAYTAEAAAQVPALDKVVLSTEDEEIAALGRSLGLDVPFLRPASLATDTTPMLPVLQHAVGVVEAAGLVVSIVVLLQPTCPLLRPEHVTRAMTLLETGGADSVVSVHPVPTEFHPQWVYRRDDDGALTLWSGERTPVSRRQDLPPVWHRDGMVYVVRRDVLQEQDSLYGKRSLGLVIDDVPLLNIDTPEDWERAERLLAGEA